VSAADTKVPFLKFLIDLLALLPVKWFLPDFVLLNFPLPVFVNLLAADLLVFTFGILFPPSRANTPVTQQYQLFFSSFPKKA